MYEFSRLDGCFLGAAAESIASRIQSEFYAGALTVCSRNFSLQELILVLDSI